MKIIFSSDCYILRKIYLESYGLSLCLKKLCKYAFDVVPAVCESSQEITLPVFLPKSHTSETSDFFFFFNFYVFMWTRRFRKIVQLFKQMAKMPVCMMISSQGDSVVVCWVRISCKRARGVTRVST